MHMMMNMNQQNVQIHNNRQQEMMLMQQEHARQEEERRQRQQVLAIEAESEADRKERLREERELAELRRKAEEDQHRQKVHEQRMQEELADLERRKQRQQEEAAVAGSKIKDTLTQTLSNFERLSRDIKETENEYSRASEAEKATVGKKLEFLRSEDRAEFERYHKFMRSTAENMQQMDSKHQDELRGTAQQYEREAERAQKETISMLKESSLHLERAKNLDSESKAKVNASVGRSSMTSQSKTGQKAEKKKQYELLLTSAFSVPPASVSSLVSSLCGQKKDLQDAIGRALAEAAGNSSKLLKKVPAPCNRQCFAESLIAMNPLSKAPSTGKPGDWTEGTCSKHKKMIRFFFEERGKEVDVTEVGGVSN